MKLNNIILIICMILLFSISINAIFASDSLENNITASEIEKNENLNYYVQNDDNKINQEQQDQSILESKSKTITIIADKKNPNQVLNPTVQPAINSANPGDTIILKGNFVHCHFTINKTLTIIGDDATIDPCPHHTHKGIKEHGVFYITPEGSGSVIEGFTFINKDKSETPFSFLINGASDVTIKNCNMNEINPNVDKYTGIIIKNSKNILLSNLFINNTLNGIQIYDSSNVNIIENDILNSNNSAIAVLGDSNNIYIKTNNILNNKEYGIKLLSADNIYITTNLIKNNGQKNEDSGSGIYVNTNITKIIVKGNLFISNGLHAIMYDYNTINLNNEDGADKLTIIDNNYFEGHSSMILHHRIYEEIEYGDTGEVAYSEGKSYVYMQHALINKEIVCGFTYYTTKIPWTLNAPSNNGKYDLNLKLSDIKQIKNGIYQTSIVDVNGNVATDFNSIYFTFFLNDYNTLEPEFGNIYKKVLVKNGVATADFRDVYSLYKKSSNIITAAFPGSLKYVEKNIHTQYNVANSDIPINPATSIISSTLTTYPLSDSYFSIKLINSNKKPIIGEKITFKINGKVYTVKTDNKGIAKVKISLTSKGKYSIIINYAGSDDYKKCQKTENIVVKTGNKKSKIKASNLKLKKNKKKTFKLKLTTSTGKSIKNQKVVVKFNNKKYIVKTNKKGIGKIVIKLKKPKKYKITMKFLGNSKFKSTTKSNTITVTK